MKKIYFLLFVLAFALNMQAEYKFSDDKVYYITCNTSPNGFIGIGSYHNVQYELYYVRNTAVTDDGYWKIKAEGDAFTIQSSLTGQYLAWCDVYQNNCKYLTLVDDVEDDNARWYFNNHDTYLSIQNVAQTSYNFNLRNSTYLVGTYSSNSIGNNGQFRIYDSDGVEVTWDEGGTSSGDDYEEQLRQSKLYLFHNLNEYGYIVYNPDIVENNPVLAGVTTSSRSVADERFREDVDEGNPNHQWKIIYDTNDNVAFYNVGKGMYLHVTLSSSYNVPNRNASFGSTPTFYEKLKQKAGAYVFSLGNYNVPYLCAAPQQAGGTTITHYNDINDAGSLFELVEVSGETVKVSDVTLSSTALKMPAGKSYSLTATVLPQNANNKKLTWSSTNNNVATVSSDGEIKAVAVGTTTIKAVAKDGSGKQATCSVTVYQPTVDEASNDVLFVMKANGGMDAFPVNYIASRQDGENGALTITTTQGTTFEYQPYEVESVSNTAPTDLPELSSFKFNNKFNDQLIDDVEAEGNDRGDGVTVLPRNIALQVGSAIGKRLTASFKTTTDDAAVYINGVEQVSKVSRQRFDKELVYRVAPRSYKIYMPSSVDGDIVDISNPNAPVVLVPGASGEASMQPYGLDYTVNVEWATDNSQGNYNVPVVYITTEDGLGITSKETYKNATISIDGVGVYPDFPETAVQIKGRGNSSWSNVSNAAATGRSMPKNPYRLKFDSKQNPFNLKKGKSWVLLANKLTGSMTTNALAMKIADMVQSPGCNHIIPVELYVNGDYRGNYNFTEKVGFSNNSIDLDDDTNAFMLELDSYYDETYRFKDNSYKLPVNLKEPDLTEETNETVAQNKFNAIKSHFNTFTQILNRGTGEYADYIDVDASMRTMLVQDLIANTELNHPKSWYIYNENGLVPDGADGFSFNMESPYVLGPVWDCDWTYGYNRSSRFFIDNAELDLFNLSNSSNVGLPFFNNLMRNSDAVKKAYYSLWYHFVNDGKVDELVEYCDDYFNFVNPSLQHNATVWNDGNSYSTQNTNAKSWLAKRANYIFTHLQTYDLSDEEAALLKVGDVNEDGEITTADVVCALNYIMGRTNDSFEFKQADTDENGYVTMRDVADIVRMMLENTPKSSRRYQLPMAEAALSLQSFEAEAGKVAEMPLALTVGEGSYCGLQFDVNLPAGCTLEGVQLPEGMSGYSVALSELQPNRYRVSIYGSAQQTISEGKSEMKLDILPDMPLAAEQCVVTITDAMLVDEDAEDNRLSSTAVKFSMPTEGATGVGRNAVNGADTPQYIYDMQGRNVTRLSQHGVYIINGKKVVK